MDNRKPGDNSAAGTTEAAIKHAPTDWRIVAGGVEAEHAVHRGWSLHQGLCSLLDRRDECWLTVERGGEPAPEPSGWSSVRARRPEPASPTC